MSRIKEVSKPKLIATVLQLLILVGLSTPLIYAIYKQWVGVQATLISLNWNNLAIGTLIQLIGLPIMGIISWVILRFLNAHQPVLRVMGIYFISQVAKYLPGGIWAFPGRALVYQAVGVDKVASVVSVVREVIGLYLGAAGIGLLGLIQGLPIADWINITIFLGVLVSILFIILTQVMDLSNYFKRFKFMQSANLAIVETGNSRLKLHWLGFALALSSLYWIITGIGFHYIILAVKSNAYTLTWLQSTSIFSLAWCAGFVVFLAPAGIGVRESALTLLLSQSVPVSEALSIAIVARLWWTATEAIFIIISLFWFSGKANRVILNKVWGIK